MNSSSARTSHEPWVARGSIDCHAADMTVTIGADVSLRELRRELARFDQWLPIDGDESLRVGKLVEENSSGPLRLGYGAWRDLLLGCQFQDGNGQLITVGGRTMKNVAGYDVTKFMIGQRGIFGRIVTITTRTYKRPGGAIVARFAASDQWISKVMPTPLRPRWAILNADGLSCGWLEDAAGLDFFEREIVRLEPVEPSRKTPDDEIALRQRLWRTGENSFRASVPPTKILRFIAESGCRNWSADAAFGIVVGPMESLDPAQLSGAAVAVGGSATIFRAGEPPVWSTSNARMKILRDLKKAFDPGGKLSPLE